jgi:hypothetical protein
MRPHCTRKSAVLELHLLENLVLRLRNAGLEARQDLQSNKEGLMGRFIQCVRT